MRLGERLSTIAATATLTSVAWVLFGAVWLSRVEHQAVAPSAAAPPVPVAANGGAATAPIEAVPSAPPTAGGLVIPVAGVKAEQLSDTYDDARGGGSRRHEALDIMAPRGTPVLAAAAGTVEKLFHSDAGGITIYVRSPDRTTIHYYAHLDHYAGGLHEGQAVSQGQILGAVGSTGDASPDAPHLHFEIMKITPAAKWYEPASDIDPYPILTGKQPPAKP